MSSEAIGPVAPDKDHASILVDVADVHVDLGQSPKTRETSPKLTGLHSPPDSNNAAKLDGSDSELSDIEDMEEPPKSTPPNVEPVEPVDDIGEVLPDHWSGTVPVFKPTMHQFKDFKRFMEKIDSYGMKSGIVKIIPPSEWKDSLPPLDDLVKTIRVREPIKQDIMGSNGTYRQVNILHQRSYNIPQWRQLCDQSEHQPPARRGERRAHVEKPKGPPRAARVSRSAATGNAASKAAPKPAPGKKKRGRPARKAATTKEDADPEDRPLTPVSPAPEEEPVKSVEEPVIKQEDGDEDEDEPPVVRRMGGVRQPKTQSVSARRKYSKREGSAQIDEAAFKDFDYRMDISDYTPERCEELEKTYWKTLTYAPPLYGADLMGTLFHEDTELWNLNKLPNLLDVLGTKVPGVNTAYLYLGMWKATFAWHLEDVDLYSINYLHFGAPKQWYSISQADARRFEAAMRSIWPTEAKACDQFLRHKAFLISPSHLKQYFNITVNKVVSYPGEFVVTYPYGYHSGYNLGYNCAEAVNFALDSWLPMGKIAKRCECAQAQDSVWVDVYEIERKLRGESTEYEETEDEEDEEEDDDDNDTGLLSPPSSHTVRVKGPGRKRKRAPGEKEVKAKKRKIRLRLKTVAEPPCCLCPNDIAGVDIIPTDDGRKAHRMCALYVPETYIETVDGKEIAANVAKIDKARLELKCLYCRSKRGACFQCSHKKCARSYHATCAAAAGVFVEEEEVPVFGEDGTEYKEQAFEFSCRFHRTKREKKLDGDALDGNPRVRKAAAVLKKDDICQLQYYRGDIFAGVVVENRSDEETLLLDIIPNGDRVEVEWKWLLLPDPADFRLQKASANALPMPTTRKAQQELNAKKRPEDELPRKDDLFVEGGFTWSEFNQCEAVRNPEQVKVDLSKELQVWHYLGQNSTETKAQYTEDPNKRVHNTKSSFMDSVPKPPVSLAPRTAAPRKPSFAASYPRQAMPPPAAPLATPALRQLPAVPKQQDQAAPKPQDKPYVYKPKKPAESRPGGQFTPQKFVQKPAPPISPVSQQLVANQQRAASQQHIAGKGLSFGTDPRFKGSATFRSSASDRFAPYGGINGFPQLPGLTWPPAHMKSGQYSQPQTRVWPNSTSTAGARPERVPMTSSELKPTSPTVPKVGAASSQQNIHAYQKYSFFQVHHNRDASRYRTPYNLYGGFTNGYEGNLRTFLLKAQQSLSGGKGQSQARRLPSLPPKNLPGASAAQQSNAHAPPPYSSPYGQHLTLSPTSFRADLSVRGDTPISPSPYMATPYSPVASTPAMWDVRQPSPTPLHPAIRPQYANPWQQSFAQQGQGQHQYQQQIYGQHAYGQQHYGPQNYGVSPIQYGPEPKPRFAPHISAPSPMNNRAPAFTKQSYSPIPLPSYVKRLSVSSRASSPSSLLAQHSSTVSGDGKHLSVPTVPHRSVPSPAPDQQEASAYQVQQNRSEHNSSPLFGLSADSPLSFSGIDSGPPGPVENDVKSEAGMDYHGDMQFPLPQYTNNHYSPMMPQMEHSPVMHHAHHHGHHMSASAGQNDFPEALVEKMMLDLRRASTGGGLG